MVRGPTVKDQEANTCLGIPENVQAWFSGEFTRDTIPPVYVREWLGDVIGHNYRIFFGIAYGFFRDRNRAEDAVQEAVLKGLRNLGRLKQLESIVNWFASITRNTCLELIRRGQNRVTKSLEDAEEMAAPDSLNMDRYDQKRLLLAAINSLPESQAIVVLLRFMEGCDVDDIAGRLGIKRNAVEVRLHRALSRLARQNSIRTLRGTLA